MGRRIRVTALRNKEQNLRLYVLALLALVRQMQEAEQQQKDDGALPAAPEGSEEVGHD
ncbi:hypothetical protein Rhe02_47100 [Rhizocola hellebori]|uniref:Uncharacterized protein n=1 Tax=Rhizocola hellebori TaxID=1392758 RepID=A0A8J3VI70_9ACTN|nr:hypothetical protein Rhe02_47100 [Rhizocola hellebori]